MKKVIFITLGVFVLGLLAIAGAVLYLLRGGLGETASVAPPSSDITYKKSFNLMPFGAGGDISAAKSLNANMITVFLPTFPQDSEVSLSSYVRSAAKKIIDQAHRGGLQVELRGGTAGGDGLTDINKFKPSMVSYIEALSKFAQEAGVYQLTIHGEADNLLFRFPGEITPIAQELLSAARQNYNGKIGIGVCCIIDTANYNFTGYDYLIASVYPIATTMEEYFTKGAAVLGINANLFQQLDNIQTIARQSGLQIIYLGEAGIYDTEDEKTPDEFKTLRVSLEEEAEYYRKLLFHTEDIFSGYSFFLGDQGLGVKTDPASEVVKEFYAGK